MALTVLAGITMMAFTSQARAATEPLNLTFKEVRMNVGTFKALPVVAPGGTPARLNATYDTETGAVTASSDDFVFPDGVFDISNAVAPGLPGDGSTLTVGLSANPVDEADDIVGSFDPDSGVATIEMEAQARIKLNLTGVLESQNGSCQISPIPLEMSTTGALVDPGDPDGDPPVPPTNYDGAPFAPPNGNGAITDGWETLPEAGDDPDDPANPCAGAGLVNGIAGGEGGVWMSGTTADESGFQLSLDRGVMHLGGAGANLDVIDPSNPVTLNGEYTDENGAFTVPVEGFVFPDQSITDPLPATISMGLNEPIDGTFDEATGALVAPISLRAQIDLGGLGSCVISPVQVTLDSSNGVGFKGVPFTSGLTGPGAISGAWTDLPAPTGGPTCATFGALLGGPGGIWLANGISTPEPGTPWPTTPTCEQDPNQPQCEQPCSVNPNQPQCEQPCSVNPNQDKCKPPAGKARVRVNRVAPKAKRVKRGKAVTVSVVVRNAGNARATGVRVCAVVPAKQRKRIRVRPACRRLGAIAAGQRKVAKLRIKTTRRARGQARVQLRVTSANAGAARGATVLRIR